LIQQANERLIDAEGHSLERLVGTLYAERSRKGIGDFPLSELVHGWWDRSDTEIDIIAVDADHKRIRLGSCKRSADRLVKDLHRFNGHIDRFLSVLPRFKEWRVEKIAVAPLLTPEQRQQIIAESYIPQDLYDLTAGLQGK
jgi:hypothetical protein